MEVGGGRMSRMGAYVLDWDAVQPLSPYIPYLVGRTKIGGAGFRADFTEEPDIHRRSLRIV